MTALQSLTFIEVDIEFCSLVYGVAPCTASIPTTGPIKCFNSKSSCQDTAHFTPGDVTLRFAKPTNYLPRDIDCIPSISEVSYTPATISLGKDLGTRATLSVTFKDHPHSDTGEGFDKYLADRTYDPFSQGTFWGKFRSRQPFLRGQPIRWITGLVGDDIDDMETRHFIIDSFDGPTPDGKYTIVAKDVLKLADGDRSQAPDLSNGFLSADITAVATAAALLPTGIGNAEYPLGGTDYLCIGGNEIVQYSRTGDSLAITRGQLGSTATTHKAGDRVQRVLRYSGTDVAVILTDLFLNYADVPSSYIVLTDWQTETDAFLGTVYTGTICEPTSVATLASELCEQAGLAIWDDNIEQKLRLQVLRGVVTDADTFTPDNTLQGTLTIKEQPETRLSRVQTYFGQKDPTKPLSNLDNFRSTSLVIDEDAELDYGSAAIKTIYSRWIPEAGRSVADRLGAILLGRFRDPPRRLTFATSRYAETDVSIGIGYRVESYCVQDVTGAQSDIPIQVTRLNAGPEKFAVEAEEMLWSAPDADLANRIIIFDANTLNVNLRSAHDSIYPAPQSGDDVTCIVNAGVVIGSTSTSTVAFDVGTWPAGVTITLKLSGRLQGRGGGGGAGGSAPSSGPGGAGNPGEAGGRALYTRYAINLEFPSGSQIWGGGGGGGGGGSGATSAGGGGGGGAGGSGQIPGSGAAGGAGGGAGSPGVTGIPGTLTAGGGDSAGGAGGAPGGRSGAGGGPGGSGNAGQAGSAFGFPGGAGGASGAGGTAVDGISFVTVTVSGGDVQGPQIN